MGIRELAHTPVNVRNCAVSFCQGSFFEEFFFLSERITSCTPDNVITCCTLLSVLHFLAAFKKLYDGDAVSFQADENGVLCNL